MPTGRKPRSLELSTQEIATKAIIAVHGSLENGMKELLKSGEPSLVRFVYEHAHGKSPDVLQLNGQLNGEIVVTVNRNRSQSV